MALFPPGGKPKEMRFRGWRIVVAARFAAAFQSMARLSGRLTMAAGGESVMGSTSGDAR